MHGFLPTNKADLDARGWDAVDIVIVSGDAHVDHPSFGPILIAVWGVARFHAVSAGSAMRNRQQAARMAGLNDVSRLIASKPEIDEGLERRCHRAGDRQDI